MLNLGHERRSIRGVPLLPRFSDHRLADERKIAQAILEAGAAEAPTAARGATAGGDRRRARGVPILGRGIGGTAPGTNPLGELLRKESRRG